MSRGWLSLTSAGHHAELEGWGDIAQASALRGEVYEYIGRAPHREEAELLQGDGEEEEDLRWGRSAFRHIRFPGDTEMQGENPHVPQGLPWLAPSLPSPDLGQGHEALLLWNLSRKLGLKQSGSLNWVGSRCADTSRGIRKVPWGDMQRLPTNLARLPFIYPRPHLKARGKVDLISCSQGLISVDLG